MGTQSERRKQKGKEDFHNAIEDGLQKLVVQVIIFFGR